MNVFGTGHCGEIILPAICEEPFEVPLKTQIAGLIILPNSAAPPPYWTSYEHWLDVIDNSNGDNTKAKLLKGIGELPSPEEVTVTLGKSNQLVVSRLYSLLFDTSLYFDADYLLHQKLQQNYRAFRFWILTLAGRIIGGNKGIKPDFVSASAPYGRSRTDYEVSKIVMRWKADIDAPRGNLPQILYGVNAPSIGGGNSEGIPDTPIDSNDLWMLDESGNYPTL